MTKKSNKEITKRNSLAQKLIDLYANKITVNRCPYCNSTKIYKHGKYKYTERYKCKECNRTFIPSTGTLLHYLKKKEVFIEYAGYVKNEGLSTIREISKNFNISVLTAFDWRHKILASIPNNNISFDNKIVCNDLWFMFSNKGRKGILNPRQRGTRITKTMENNCSKLILVGDNKNYNVLTKLSTVGKLNDKHLFSAIGEQMLVTKEITCSSKSCYLNFIKYFEVTHKNLNVSIFKRRDLMALKFIKKEKLLKYLINYKHKGVSTKYLQLYCNYYASKKKFDPLSKKSLKRKFVWRIFTDIENIYKTFIINKTSALYSIPIKRYWKSSLNFYFSENFSPY